jgi:glycosyltransferase involved in cell wall biosynthesis
VNKVIHFITTIDRGGAENQLVTLVREQVNQKLDVSIVYLKGNSELADEFKKIGAKIVNSVSNKNILFQIIQLWILNRRSNFIVHAHLPRAELIASIIKGKNCLVLSKHNSEPFFPGAPKIISRNLARYVNKRADTIVCISNAVKQFILNNREILSTNKMVVIYYGADQIGYKPNDKANFLKQELGIQNNFIFGTVARIEKQKDYPVLMKAFSDFLRTHPNSKLLIVGEGSLLSQLQLLGNSLNLNNNIVWVGKVPNPMDYINLMDVFVLVSKYEGFGLVLVESMQVGKPILAANNSSIPEVLGSEYKGLFDTGDFLNLSSKMKECLRPDYTESLKVYLQVRLQNFKSDVMAANILNIYQETDPENFKR